MESSYWVIKSLIIQYIEFSRVPVYGAQQSTCIQSLADYLYLQLIRLPGYTAYQITCIYSLSEYLDIEIIRVPVFRAYHSNCIYSLLEYLDIQLSRVPGYIAQQSTWIYSLAEYLDIQLSRVPGYIAQQSTWIYYLVVLLYGASETMIHRYYYFLSWMLHFRRTIPTRTSRVQGTHKTYYRWVFTRWVVVDVDSAYHNHLGGCGVSLTRNCFIMGAGNRVAQVGLL